jgi:hypothetical protein
LLLLDGQVHHDTHAVPMGNYAIGVGNYVIVSPSELGNYKIADTAGTNSGHCYKGRIRWASMLCWQHLGTCLGSSGNKTQLRGALRFYKQWLKASEDIRQLVGYKGGISFCRQAELGDLCYVSFGAFDTHDLPPVAIDIHPEFQRVVVIEFSAQPAGPVDVHVGARRDVPVFVAGIEADVFLVVVDVDDGVCLRFSCLQSVKNRTEAGHVILARVGHSYLPFCRPRGSFRSAACPNQLEGETQKYLAR